MEDRGKRWFYPGQVSNTSLFVSNGYPYVAYEDLVNGDNRVMAYKAPPLPIASAAPVTWQTVGNAGFGGANSECESLYVDNGTPYVAFQDTANGQYASVMKFNGSAWVNVGLPDFPPGKPFSFPSSSITGHPMRVIWMRDMEARPP